MCPARDDIGGSFVRGLLHHPQKGAPWVQDRRGVQQVEGLRSAPPTNQARPRITKRSDPSSVPSAGFEPTASRLVTPKRFGQATCTVRQRGIGFELGNAFALETTKANVL